MFKITFECGVDNLQFGKNMKRMREERKFTCEQLAEKMEVTTETVQHWESGDSLPSKEHLARLAGLFECDMADILALPEAEEVQFLVRTSWNLKHMMLERGFTRRRLARELDVPVAVVESWESGKLLPSNPEHLKRLTRTLGCCVTDILAWTETDAETLSLLLREPVKEHERG